MAALGNPPANTRDVERQVRSLGWEDPLEEGGHGNPLQYFCLENLAEGYTVHRVTKSRTQMKRLNTHTCVGIVENKPVKI